MKQTPHFSFRDILSVPGKALSAKQILVATLFFIGALVVYDLFTYIAYSIDGEELGTVFSAYGFFPFEQAIFGSIASRLVFLVGVLLSVFTLMLGMFGVAAINIESIRGNRFLSAQQAIKFAFKRFPQIFLAELAIALFVGLIILLFFLLGLASRIPFVGEWLFTIFFALPNFIIALFSVFILFVFMLTILLLPAVAAAERQGETFNAILETFSTIILQPFRWAGYTLYTLVVAKLCGFIYAYFAFRAVELMTLSASLGGGAQLRGLVKSSLAHLPIDSGYAREMFNLFPGINFGIDLKHLAGYPSNDAISYVMAFMLFVICASIVGYMIAVVAAGQARTYVAIRFMKDGYNISEEDSLFFTDEHVNERVNDTESKEPPLYEGSED